MAYQSMNFPELFRVAQEMREGRTRGQLADLQLEQGRYDMEQRRLATEREGRLRLAMAAWYKGNKAPLQEQFPAEAAEMAARDVKVQADEAGLTKTRAETGELQRRRSIEVANATTRAVRMATEAVRANPAIAGVVEGRLRAMHDAGEIYLPQETYGIVTPERLPQILSDVEQRATALNQPREYAPDNFDARVANALGYKGDVKRAQQDPRWPRKYEELMRAGGTVINNNPLAKGNVESAEAEIKDAYNDLQTLEGVRNAFDPKFLGWKSRLASVGKKITSVAGWSPDFLEEWNREKTDMMEPVTAIYLKYRKGISGVSFKDAEVEEIQKATLNPNMSPAEFKASLNRLIRKLNTAIDIAGAFLERGVPKNPKERQAFDAELHQRIAESDRNQAHKRWKELEGQGFDPEGIKARLLEEGYVARPKITRQE